MTSYSAIIDIMKSIQITLRNVSPRLHRALAQRANERGASMNTLALNLLEAQLGLGEQITPKRDISWFVGSNKLEPKVIKELDSLRVTDPDLWE